MLKTTKAGLSAAAIIVAGLGFGIADVSSAQAEEMSPWMIRGRALVVVPQEDLNSTSPALPGASVSIDNSVVPELDITYFFTPNIAAELILGTTPHDANVHNPNVDLGSVWLLPPTLTLQYHFAPEGKIRPYVGAGVNYTIFYGKDEPTGTTVDYDNAFGWALQAGVDIPINDHWSMNVDVKQVFLSTDVTINGAVKADVDINPTLIGFGLGYRF
ncbi:OmpW family protein [Zavarzinia compransoris]|uniref:OmpW/AlkL family protein n=1 Tax=Zavarzinia marina TaxID=2911065 RepID=UPI001F21C5A8|nr:OmpW family protein [Zavarzinia marina]MCF4167663.1 OmpW family protein [Zavarzinia marina]